MSISVTCECGRHFETSEVNAGRRARCPDCGREFTVPDPVPPPEVMHILDEPKRAVTSGKAMASLALGVLFFFACFSGLPAIFLGSQALHEIDRSKGRLRGRKIAIAGIVFGVIGFFFTCVILMPNEGRETARRSQCVNNLKQLGIAMYNYVEANGSLPPAAITDRNGKPLLSWRVAILPYIEESSLYSKFHLDEPWDSPHNLVLLEPMPSVYGCPSDTTRKPGTTGYQAIIGPNTAFTPDFKTLQVQDFTDGTSNTLIVAESRRCVTWTKPEDLPFNTTLPLSGLGSFHGSHKDRFNVLFADGSVRLLKSSIAPAVLRALLTRNGNEMVSPESY
jgi:prepilin-type processing-associated H-X9-DG protein